jgi:catechol 2,3-dioxygenase-like lactoylglutathione lyase family enzyme
MIRGLDHINIGTDRLAATTAFFRDVLGLKEGWRPDFPFAGAWLYSGDTAVVHLVELEAPRGPSRAASMDHAAFRIEDYEACRGRLDAAGIAYRTIDIPGTEIRQIFITDLNGVNIELNARPGP